MSHSAALPLWCKQLSVVCLVCSLVAITGQGVDINVELTSQSTCSEFWYEKPATYNELVEGYHTLEAAYPEYIEIINGSEFYEPGGPGEGYEIYFVCITNESRGMHKPEVLYLGSPHGDETVGTIGLYWFCDWLMRMAYTDAPCEGYSKDWLRWLVDNREIYIEICHNPVGFDWRNRYDGNGWDLNREADYAGPGEETGGIWGSVNGRILRRFLDNHTIRVGCDFHGGARALLYPWSSTHDWVMEQSLLSGRSYMFAPPDFHFFDASTLRLGSYIGDFGGNLSWWNCGPLGHELYQAAGVIVAWAYGADVARHPAEDIFVDDEIFGNYPGAGVLWLTPEMYGVKDPDENMFGNDTINGFGAEVRRFVLHQTDLAQPYIRWQPGSIANGTWGVEPGENVTFTWQVNGSLVVDHTYLAVSSHSDPIENPDFITTDFDAHAGDPLGGTGWDNAVNGSVTGTTYIEHISFSEPGTYYVVAKAQVDQCYSDVVHSEIYGTDPYLRLLRERTDDLYHEEILGYDGLEVVDGQLWWYSPIVLVSVGDNRPPGKPIVSAGSRFGQPQVDYSFSSVASDTNGDALWYLFDWGDGSQSNWMGPFPSGSKVTASHQWESNGTYDLQVKVKDDGQLQSSWSDELCVVLEDEPPAISFVKPDSAIYIFNRELCPFFIPFVIGSVDIDIAASDNISGIDRVEFYINDILVGNISSAPYMFSWKQLDNKMMRNTISVSAYDKSGNGKNIRKTVFRLF